MARSARCARGGARLQVHECACACCELGCASVVISFPTRRSSDLAQVASGKWEVWHVGLSEVWSAGAMAWARGGVVHCMWESERGYVMARSARCARGGARLQVHECACACGEVG